MYLYNRINIQILQDYKNIQADLKIFSGLLFKLKIKRNRVVTGSMTCIHII